MQKYWPILMVIAANVAYNITAKQTPKEVNPFLSLVITYGAAMLVCLVLFLGTRSGGVVEELKKTNWTAYVFGLCIIALEFGYLNIYRVGWQINTASLVANISLAVILLFVGFAFYRESISLKQLAGAVLCAAGLILITKN